MSKFKIFKSLTKDKEGGEIHPLVNDVPKEALKEIRSQLCEVVNSRDAFAHGKIYFWGEKPKLKFFRGKIREIDLTMDYLDQQRILFNRCYNNLQVLYNHLTNSKKIK